MIILANCLIFVYLHLAGGLEPWRYQAYLAQFGLVPARFFSRELFSFSGPVPVVLTPIAAMFLHGNLLHLAGNMLYMWIFGNNVEDYLGHVRFTIFYFITGLAASAAFMIFSPFSHYPMVGASGAIAGVLGAYFILWPRARIKTLVFLFIFITTLEIPAVIVLGFWIIIQILEGFSSVGRSTGIAWFAHIGGFFAGILLILPAARRKRRR